MPRLSSISGRKLAAHLFVIAVLAAWAGASMRVPAYVLPGPDLVFLRTLQFFTNAKLFGHIASSVSHVGCALAISFVAGTSLAFLAHYFPTTRMLVQNRIAAFLNSFSSIGWALLAILWFGLNSATVIFVITMIILPISIINMQAALDNLDADLTEMGQSFTRKWRRNFTAIVLPSLYPFMFATLRISFGVAWKVALTAELFGGNSGFGFLVNIARQEIDTPQIFAVVVLMVIISFIADRFVFAPLQRALSKHYGDA